jgi:PAS domain S-box-containing protein
VNVDRMSQDVLDVLHDGVVIQDAGGGIVYANPAAEGILGVTASEMTGLTSKDPRWDAVDVHGAPIEYDEHPIVTARVTGEPVRGLLLGVRRGDGQRAWVEIDAMPLIDDPDAPAAGSVAVFRDITDELGARRALRTSEERFRTAVETMMDGFMIWRAVRDANEGIVDFVCEFANPAVEAFGYTQSELVGVRLRDFAPELSEHYLVRYTSVVETGEALRTRIPWYEGPRFQGSFDVSAVRMGDGIALTFRDVTQEHADEQKLRDSEEQTRRFLEAIPMGVAIVEPGNIVFVNDALRQILGDVDTETRGPGLIDYFGLRRAGTDQPYPFDELPLARAFFHGETSTADDIVVSRGGREIPVEGYAAPVRDSTGEVRWALTLLNDITERRLQDEALTEALAELAAINGELADFAAIAAHDLAAPLRAIAGFAAQIEEHYADALDPRAREWIGNVLAESDRMRTFIDELLAYSRAGSARAPAQVELGPVASAALDGLRAKVERTGATVEIGPLPVVAGDPTALGQVFHNLLANAMKFHAPGRAPTVQVESERDDGHWIITVADDGIGVADEERDRVFAAFHRASGAPDAPGHGLGLSICRRIVERHGGRIWVEPRDGGGSRFRFSLPAD